MSGTSDDGEIEIGGEDAAMVARDARCGSGRGTARDAARTALMPTLEALQQSVFAPRDRMLPTVPLGRSPSPRTQSSFGCPGAAA